MLTDGIALPPGPRSRVPLRLEHRFLRDPPGFLRELSTYGDIAHMRFLSRRVYLVTDPELIQRVLAADHRSFVKGRSMEEARRVLGDGLLTSEGEYHHRQRRLLQPALQRTRVEALAGRMTELAERRISAWRAGETLDLHLELSRLTLEIVADTLLSVDLERESEEIAKALTYSVSMIGRLTLPAAKVWERSPLQSARRFRAAVRRLERATHDILERRRALSHDPDDAITLLLGAQQDGEHAVTDRQVRDEAITLLLAGHETTANLLTWALYLLWKHPEVEARLRAELEAVIGDRPPTVHDAAALEYAEQVLNETLRLYPPVWAMGRIALEDYRLDGYTIPAGSVVALNAWVMHHDARFYPDPFAFDPGRWTPDARRGRPRYAFFPFGGGPRICMGATFAMLEAKLVLATLLRHWQFRLAAGQRVEAAPVLTLRPRHGLRMTLAPSSGPETAGAERGNPSPAGEFWDHAVELWGHGRQRLWRRHSDGVNARLVDRWLPQGVRRVLKTDLWDEAVGEGLYPTLSARAEATVGIDASPGVVRAACDRYPGLVAEEADVRRLPFANESFDAAVSNSTLDHFDSAADILAALRELHRVLEPGGLLVLTLDNPANPFVALTRLLPRELINRFWLDHARGAARVGMLPYYVGITVGGEHLRALLAAAGFELRDLRPIMHAPRPLAILAGAFVEHRGSPRATARLARTLELCERLESSRLRFRTGHFTAVLATRR